MNPIVNALGHLLAAMMTIMFKPVDWIDNRRWARRFRTGEAQRIIAQHRQRLGDE